MNKKLLIGLAVVLLLVVGYMMVSRQSSAPENSGSDEVGQDATPDQTEIEIANYTYSPSTIKARPGEAVLVTNRDTDEHTLTSDEPGLFDTGLIVKDDTVIFAAPSEPGTYSYHCTPHPNMTGVLIVAE